MYDYFYQLAILLVPNSVARSCTHKTEVMRTNLWLWPFNSIQFVYMQIRHQFSHHWAINTTHTCISSHWNCMNLIWFECIRNLCGWQIFTTVFLFHFQYAITSHSFMIVVERWPCLTIWWNIYIYVYMYIELLNVYNVICIQFYTVYG